MSSLNPECKSARTGKAQVDMCDISHLPARRHVPGIKCLPFQYLGCTNALSIWALMSMCLSATMSPEWSQRSMTVRIAWTINHDKECMICDNNCGSITKLCWWSWKSKPFSSGKVHTIAPLYQSSEEIDQNDVHESKRLQWSQARKLTWSTQLIDDNCDDVHMSKELKKINSDKDCEKRITKKTINLLMFVIMFSLTAIRIVLIRVQWGQKLNNQAN